MCVCVRACVRACGRRRATPHTHALTHTHTHTHSDTHTHTHTHAHSARSGRSLDRSPYDDSLSVCHARSIGPRTRTSDNTHVSYDAPGGGGGWVSGDRTIERDTRLERWQCVCVSRSTHALLTPAAQDNVGSGRVGRVRLFLSSIATRPHDAEPTTTVAAAAASQARSIELGRRRLNARLRLMCVPRTPPPHWSEPSDHFTRRL